ncbi:MAG: HDOD domain-containing protein [Bdellovibrionales bacterium]|nr:HDOD domain-containing protein [Bdellovibrionales bacterium]
MADIVISRSIRRYGSGTRKDTTDTLLRGWIPPTPGLLSEIQEKIADGAYSAGQASICTDIESDIALATHCLRHLSQVAAERMWDSDPFEALASLDDEQLARVFSLSENAVSKHRFNRMNSFQTTQLSHSLTSLAGLEVLSEEAALHSATLDPKHAAACALLRQLVPNLFAWNYPRLYPKVLRTVRRGEATLEQAIERLFGDPPNRIARSFAAEWRLRPQLQQAVAFTASNPNPNLPRRMDFTDPTSAEAIGAFCEIAEGLARLQNPKQFPKADREWEDTAPHLTRYLGEDRTSSLMHRLEQTAGDRLERYSSVVGKSLFERRTVRRGPPAKDARNPHLHLCREAVRSSLTRVYCDLEVAPTQALQTLIVDTVVAAGFVSGCVFLAAEPGAELTPAVFIGAGARSRYRASDPYIRSILSDSVFRETPFCEQGMLKDGSLFRHVTAAAGGSIELGVLSLELSPETPAGSERLLNFKAIRHALHDCLAALRAASARAS